MNKNINFNDIYPIIEEQLSGGGRASFIIHGTSMLPMLHHGKDSVLIEKPKGRLKKYDIPFYRRKDGSFVLHRIVKVTNDGYVCRGDHQLVDEKGVTDDMIIGVMTAYTQNGEWFDIESKKQKRYAFRRVNTVYVRRVIHFIERILHIKIFGRGN